MTCCYFLTIQYFNVTCQINTKMQNPGQKRKKKSPHRLLFFSSAHAGHIRFSCKQSCRSLLDPESQLLTCVVEICINERTVPEIGAH